MTYNNNPKVRVGSTRKDAGGVIMDIEKIVVHPNYHPDEVAFDYSLLILKEKLEFNDRVQPIKINCDCNEVPEGTPCNITGWGLTELRRFPRDLRSTNIFIVNSVCLDFLFLKFRFI
jgi:trypsin